MPAFLLLTAFFLLTTNSSFANDWGHQNYNQRLDDVAPLDTSLGESLFQGRSRRFFKGSEIPGGPLKFKSLEAVEPVSQEEEAILALSAAGITGYVFADLPYDNGPKGEGNIMMSLIGRTVASGDAGHFIHLFVVNDDGAWLMRRPQDLDDGEIIEVLRLVKKKKWIDAYNIIRVQIMTTRPVVDLGASQTPPFNVWSINRPGTTLFLPFMNTSAMYINMVLSAFSKNMGIYIIDEKTGGAAGVKKFKESKGGHLIDDFGQNRFGSIGSGELVTHQSASVEAGGMLQNLRLASHSLGLGGFPLWTASPNSWSKALGFEHVDVLASKIAGKGAMMRFFAKVLKKDFIVPTAVGLSKNGKPLIRTFNPPYYRNMTEAVHDFINMKMDRHLGLLRGSQKGSKWKRPDWVKKQIPNYTPEQIAATVQHLEYVFEKYGRIPPTMGPLVPAIAGFQSGVLDVSFYDQFYPSDALPLKHRQRSGGQSPRE